MTTLPLVSPIAPSNNASAPCAPSANPLIPSGVSARPKNSTSTTRPAWNKPSKNSARFPSKRIDPLGYYPCRHRVMNAVFPLELFFQIMRILITFTEQLIGKKTEHMGINLGSTPTFSGFYPDSSNCSSFSSNRLRMLSAPAPRSSTLFPSPCSLLFFLFSLLLALRHLPLPLMSLALLPLSASRGACPAGPRLPHGSARKTTDLQQD